MSDHRTPSDTPIKRGTAVTRLEIVVLALAVVAALAVVYGGITIVDNIIKIEINISR